MKASLIIFSLLLLFVLGLAGCRAGAEPPSTTVENQPMQTEQPIQGGTTGFPATTSPTNENNLVNDPATDPVVIEAAWQSSPHADTFVLDPNGQNNTCARCHAPINWLPTMEDLPESCYACKFELEPPPPTIAEQEWVDVPCKICHKVDKKNVVQPEYAWLEIAPLDEYAKVATVTELCLKCHAPVDIPGHAAVQVGGAHAGYECTQCHSAHDTLASCNPAGCHVESSTPIPGHDADHQSVSCVACHDANSMEVGPDEETALWTTYTSTTTDSGAEKFTFTSHNVVLEASCDRCHFVNNPWGLTDHVVEP